MYIYSLDYILMPTTRATGNTTEEEYARNYDFCEVICR